MKLVSYIVGSEARWLTETFPTDKRKIPYLLFVKLRAWILSPFIQEYWVDSDYLVQFIHKFKKNAKTRVVADTIKYSTKYPKIKHDGFNVMYYYPKNEYNKIYCQWVYGKDIIDRLISLHPEYNWVKIDGSQDLSKEFPLIDVYIRPNRHDGASRLVQECTIQNIPVLHTQCNPQLEDFDNFLRQHYEY